MTTKNDQNKKKWDKIVEYIWGAFFIAGGIALRIYDHGSAHLWLISILIGISFIVNTFLKKKAHKIAINIGLVVIYFIIGIFFRNTQHVPEDPAQQQTTITQSNE